MDLAITDSIKDKFQLLKDMDGEIFKAVFRKQDGGVLGAAIFVSGDSAQEIVDAVQKIELLPCPCRSIIAEGCNYACPCKHPVMSGVCSVCHNTGVIKSPRTTPPTPTQEPDLDKIAEECEYLLTVAAHNCPAVHGQLLPKVFALPIIKQALLSATERVRNERDEARDNYRLAHETLGKYVVDSGDLRRERDSLQAQLDAAKRDTEGWETFKSELFRKNSDLRLKIWIGDRNEWKTIKSIEDLNLAITNSTNKGTK